jgi:hypothetical protein
MLGTLALAKSRRRGIHCEPAVRRLLERAGRLAVEISAFFLLSQPNPDPVLSVIVEEPDPSLLEG